MKIIQILVFTILQIILLPVTIIGIIPAVYKEMVVSKKLGASFTAGQVVQSHWMMHYFGIRKDDMTVKLIKNLQIESHIGLLMTMSATLLANRICGFRIKAVERGDNSKVTMTTFLPERIHEQDRLAEKHFNQVEQVVLLGAGFDLRMTKLKGNSKTKVYELDMPGTQKVKREAIKCAGIDEQQVQYIPIDFRNEEWSEKLLAAGFDPSKTSYFHWESVNCYLEEQIVKTTLNKISSLCASGSVLIVDFYSKEILNGETPSFKKAAKLVYKMGEPWKFAVDMSQDAEKEVTSVLSEFGFTIGELILFGNKDSETAPFYAVVEGIKA